MTLRRVALVFMKYLLFISILVEATPQPKVDRQPKIFKIIDSEEDGVYVQKVEPPRYYDKNYLLDFLKNNADFELRVNNILKKDIYKDKLQGLKKKLSKKIIKHGEHTEDLQYNKDRNTYFRPLVRVHKLKTFDSTEGSDRVDIEFKRRVPKAKFRLNQSKVKSNTSAAEHAVLHLSLIDKLIDRVESLSTKLDFYTKLNSIIADVETLHKAVIMALSVEDLRQGPAPPIHYMPDSVEDKKPVVKIQPGMLIKNQEVEGREVMPCAVYPDVPIWNYWTYLQTIHEDECPPDQTKIGLVCSWIPPHRRRLMLK